MADVATDNYDREFGLGLASNEQKVVWEIDEAIGRINEKTFGSCQGCEKKIAKKRLQAIPYTRFCVACQEKEEQKKKRA
jgi:RNA polymerase-binding transcription factor DksA